MMSSSNSTTQSMERPDLCVPGDTVCVVRDYETEVIVVPTLFLAAFLLTWVAVMVLRCRHEPHRWARTPSPLPRYHQHSRRHTDSHKRALQGIDAPVELNALEHEALPMTVQQNIKPTPTAATTRQNSEVHPTPPAPAAAMTRQNTEVQRGRFSGLTPLPRSFSVQRSDSPLTLHRAALDNRNVVLRVLKESADAGERRHFLGFASFLSGLGPHPFLPALLGAVTTQTPLVTVVEELTHRDLLGYLWRCRQVNTGGESPCDLTEKRIFIMAGQVASALEYLHTQNCIHGNLGARSVLIGGDLTAKLWGLGTAYRRRAQGGGGAYGGGGGATGSPGGPGKQEAMEMRKWQAPELLARTAVGPSSDVWSFGCLLYEMITLGDPPFAEIMASELLQFLQRGKTLKRPSGCSNTLFSIIKSCGQWNARQRLAMPELIGKLRAGEQSANDRTVLRVPEPLDMERYLREAGYGEAYNYAVF